MVPARSRRLKLPLRVTFLKNSVSIFFLIALTGWSAAQVPKKAPISRYTSLWTNSPFTSKPPPATEGPVENPLDDYALAGVTPIESGGYRVILLNKKQPDVRITVDTGDSRSGFKILGVTRKSGDPLGTVVRMESGSSVGTVSYDEKLLTLVAAPKAAPGAPGQPGQPGQPPIPGQPGQINNGQQGDQPQRQPRPRVVPPPTPTTTAPGAPQIQQGQPAIQNTQRPERRRN